MDTTMSRQPKVRHPLFARIYPRINTLAEAHGALEHRRELLADTAGRIVEMGAGTGANFRHYPPAVEQVIAVEPEPRLRRLAERAAADAPGPVEVRAGRAEDLPVDNYVTGGLELARRFGAAYTVPTAGTRLRRRTGTGRRPACGR